MDADEIKKYRSDVETQLKEKETDIENTITYVTIGLLGLFITINEKFIPLSSSSYKWLLLISVIGFVLSFGFGLLNKFLTTYYDRKIIDFLDNNRDLTAEDHDIQLLAMWIKYSNILQRLKKFIYVFLFLGFIFQLFYLFINLNSNEKKEEATKFEIELINSDSLLKDQKLKLYILKPADTAKVERKTDTITKQK